MHLNSISVLLTLWVSFLLNPVFGNKENINEVHYRTCSGMYSKEDWKGKVDPFISFNLKKLESKDDNEDGVIVAIFDFQDFEHIGAVLPDGEIYYICDDFAIDSGLCTEEEKNTYLVEDVVYDPFTDTNKTLAHPIMSFYQTKLGLHESKYPITSTGYYCIATMAKYDTTKYKATINFRNAYGKLPAAEINKLPLYGLLAIAYVVAMALYSFAFWKHKHELLPLQKYILAFFGYLAAETIFIWAYYDIKNEKGDTAGTKVYMVFLSILTAGKVCISFFLLLIIALGYGIVFPKLNKTLMRRCQFFTVWAFGWTVAFFIQSYLSDPEKTSYLLLITMIPMSVTIFIFYFLILRSMTKTVTYLREQRQIVKMGMYQKVLTIIYASLIIIVGGLIVSSFVYVGTNSIETVEQHWRTRFFYTDFWPTLVYFGVFVTLSFIWRPTSTSYMLASSQQLPTDPDNVTDFDLDDLQSLGEVQDDDFATDDFGQNGNPNEDDLDLNFSEEDDIPASQDDQTVQAYEVIDQSKPTKQNLV